LKRRNLGNVKIIKKYNKRMLQTSPKKLIGEDSEEKKKNFI